MTAHDHRLKIEDALTAIGDFIAGMVHILKAGLHPGLHVQRAELALDLQRIVRSAGKCD